MKDDLEKSSILLVKAIHGGENNNDSEHHSLEFKHRTYFEVNAILCIDSLLLIDHRLPGQDSLSTWSSLV